ncbi:MAG: TIGR04255 family protein [Gallionella sp.]|nr:TIGR04255 family protein [Gallionella sp.]
MTESATSEVVYARPPITEAVIGITFSSPMDTKQLASINNALQKHYPHKQDVSTFDLSLEFNIKDAGNNKANLKPTLGYRLSTDDQTQLVVIWPNSISLSQLPPYQGWGNFIERFERDWSALKKIMGFQQISRIGVRYINRIDIPATAPVIEHEQFLNIYPKMPDILNPLEAYALQASVTLKDINCQLTINTASVPSPLLEHASFVIDTDISSDKNPPQSDSDLIKLLNNIRTKKNQVFEACISQPARSLFQ